MDASSLKLLSGHILHAKADKKVPVPLAGKSVRRCPAGGEAGSNAAQVPEGNSTDALAIIPIGSKCCTSCQ